MFLYYKKAYIAGFQYIAYNGFYTACIFMEQKARIKITLNGGEFEIEGSETFVNSYAESIHNFVSILQKDASETKKNNSRLSGPGEQFSIFDGTPTAPPQKQENGALNTMESFGEFYHRRPKNVSKTDIVLMASYFIQSKSDEGIFTTREVTKLLKDHGLDLSNPAHFIKLNQEYKKVFKMRQGQYKVSEEGIEHLKSILR